MGETVALSKFACPACGGEAVWNPAKQKLVCPFCGTESPYKVTETGQIEELDLVRALREMPEDQRGWQTERRSISPQRHKASTKEHQEIRTQVFNLVFLCARFMPLW